MLVCCEGYLPQSGEGIHLRNWMLDRQGSRSGQLSRCECKGGRETEKHGRAAWTNLRGEARGGKGCSRRGFWRRSGWHGGTWVSRRTGRGASRRSSWRDMSEPLAAREHLHWTTLEKPQQAKCSTNYLAQKWRGSTQHPAREREEAFPCIMGISLATAQWWFEHVLAVRKFLSAKHAIVTYLIARCLPIASVQTESPDSGGHHHCRSQDHFYGEDL